MLEYIAGICNSVLYKKKAEPLDDPALNIPCYFSIVYFLNFHLNPTRPTRPVPRSSMVVGSSPFDECYFVLFYLNLFLIRRKVEGKLLEPFW